MTTGELPAYTGSLEISHKISEKFTVYPTCTAITPRRPLIILCQGNGCVNISILTPRIYDAFGLLTANQYGFGVTLQGYFYTVQSGGKFGLKTAFISF